MRSLPGVRIVPESSPAIDQRFVAARTRARGRTSGSRHADVGGASIAKRRQCSRRNRSAAPAFDRLARRSGLDGEALRERQRWSRREGAGNQHQRAARRLTSSRTDAEVHAGALIPKSPGVMADDACLDGAVMAWRAVHGCPRRSGASMAAVAKHLICLRRGLGRSSKSPASRLQVVPAGPANLGPAMDRRPRPDSLADADATIVPPSKDGVAGKVVPSGPTHHA